MIYDDARKCNDCRFKQYLPTTSILYLIISFISYGPPKTPVTEEERTLQRPEKQDQEERHYEQLVILNGTGTSGWSTGWELGGSTSDIG